MRHPWMFASLVFVGCQFQASCGGKTLNMENARKFVAGAVGGDVGAPPDKVVCPDEVAVAKDTTFQCTASYGDAAATVMMRQKDDQANIEISEISGIVVSRRAEEAIAKQLGESAGVYVSVDCGPRVHPAKEGESFTCTAKAKDDTITVAVKVKDAAGNVSFAVVPSAPSQ